MEHYNNNTSIFHLEVAVISYLILFLAHALGPTGRHGNSFSPISPSVVLPPESAIVSSLLWPFVLLAVFLTYLYNSVSHS